MRFRMSILALMCATSVCAQEGVEKTDHIDFSINGGQYSSLSGTYYFLGGRMMPNGYSTLFGLGLGCTRYEVNRSLKAVGIDAAASLLSEKKIVPALFFSESIFIGYESFRVLNSYDIDVSGPGSPFYGAEFGFTYKDPDSRLTLTTGVGLKAYDSLSPYLKSKLDENSLSYPSSSIYSLIKIGIRL